MLSPELSYKQKQFIDSAIKLKNLRLKSFLEATDGKKLKISKYPSIEYRYRQFLAFFKDIVSSEYKSTEVNKIISQINRHSSALIKK